MEGNSHLTRLQIIIFFGCLGIISAQTKEGETRRIGCQQKSALGRSYAGEANTTVDGIPCQRWSDTKPHDHSFTHMGDHNFCRNPNDAKDTQVWCYTTDPEVRHQNCSVPFCAPDEDNSYTHASLQKENLPPSFTISLLSWLRGGPNIKLQCCLFFLMTQEKRGIGFKFMLLRLTQNSHSNLKIC